MDQKQIGSFISRLRKEKNMTQKDLAQQLGITDRAVSKWENGRGLPDVSLMKPLCEILDITVGELLNGEPIAKKDYQEKTEFRFLDTMGYQDQKIRQKNKLLRIVVAVAVLLVLGALLLIFFLPVSRPYFRPGEELEFFYVEKTLPLAPDGEPLIRYTSPDFEKQDVTERFDLQQLKQLLPMMRVTVMPVNVQRFWVGDATYEIFGYIKSGPRAGKAFELRLGEGPTNYLQTHKRFGIMNADSWLELMELLEGWEGENREYFQWDKDNLFSIYYCGRLYQGQGVLLPLPDDAVLIDSVRSISAEPDEELECSFGTQGRPIYRWQVENTTYLAVQVSHDSAYGIALPNL